MSPARLRHRLWSLWFVVVCGTVMVGARVTPARHVAQPVTVTLTGFNEVDDAGNFGQGDPDGFASGVVVIDHDFMSWDIMYRNISGTALSGFHVHGPATYTSNGPIVVTLPLSSTEVPDGRLTGSVTLPEVGEIGIPNARFYLNLHSTGPGGFPSGAVRGQLPEPSAAGACAAAGAAALLRRRGRRQPLAMARPV